MMIFLIFIGLKYVLYAAVGWHISYNVINYNMKVFYLIGSI